MHENKFLTPLLLWLFDFLDRRCVWGVALFSVLTCMVKEDAPVYVAVIALWVVLRALTRTGAERRWGLLTGGAMLVGAVGYFLGVTAWLAADGDGVMSYRYSNFLYDGSGFAVHGHQGRAALAGADALGMLQGREDRVLLSDDGAAAVPAAVHAAL